MKRGRKSQRDTVSKENSYDGSTPLKSIQQEIFVNNLISGMCIGNAYSTAGYKSQSPSAHGIRLAKIGKVKCRLAYKKAELARRMDISQARVIQEMALLAFSNIQDFVGTDTDGEFFFRNWAALTREQLAAVESVQVTTTTTTNKKGDREFTTKNVKFKLHSKTTALEQLGKHLGVFAEDNQQKTDHVLTIRLVKPKGHQGGNGDGDGDNGDRVSPKHLPVASQ